MTTASPHEYDPDRDKMLAYANAIETVPTPILSTEQEQRDFMLYKRSVEFAIRSIRKHAAQPRND